MQVNVDDFLSSILFRNIFLNSPFVSDYCIPNYDNNNIFNESDLSCEDVQEDIHVHKEIIM